MTPRGILLAGFHGGESVSWQCIWMIPRALYSGHAARGSVWSVAAGRPPALGANRYAAHSRCRRQRVRDCKSQRRLCRTIGTEPYERSLRTLRARFSGKTLRLASGTSPLASRAFTPIDCRSAFAITTKRRSWRGFSPPPSKDPRSGSWRRGQVGRWKPGLRLAAKRWISLP